MSEQNFAEFRAKLVQLGADLDESSERIVSRIADTGLAVTKKNTPVGKYKVKRAVRDESGKVSKYKRGATKGKTKFKEVRSGKVGGNLRRNWIKGQALKVGRNWQSGYSNNVDYGIYVNNGHRIVGKGGVTKGYVKGKRMLEQGINAARQQNETIMRNEIQRVKQKGGW